MDRLPDGQGENYDVRKLPDGSYTTVRKDTSESEKVSVTDEGNLFSPIKLKNENASSQLAKNKEAGDAFENEYLKEVEKTLDNPVQQITVKTKGGTKTRIDIMARDSDGNIECIECKASTTAPLTKNQAIAFPEIEESGGIVVGNGKLGYPSGTEIPSGTKVKVVRPDVEQ